MGISAFVTAALLSAITAYLLGSISFAVIFTKVFCSRDIRDCGSGNAGATNVLRSAGKLPAALTGFCDLAKGLISVLIGKAIFGFFCSALADPAPYVRCGAYVAGIACIIGHIFPLYFGFRGGKGVITGAAMMMLIDWRVGLCCIAVFAVVMALTRIVSLSSISAALAYPIFTFLITFFADLPAGKETLESVAVFTACALLVAAVVVLKHSSNIKRILAGTEKRITIGKGERPNPDI